MRNYLKEFRFRIKDAWQSRGQNKRIDTSLARTIRESSHVAGRGAVAPRSQQADRMVQGADDYVKSFKSEGGR